MDRLINWTKRRTDHTTCTLNYESRFVLLVRKQIIGSFKALNYVGLRTDFTTL